MTASFARAAAARIARDGRFSTDELRARLVASGRCFPIIFMTAFPTEAICKRVMAAGAHCYLNKPSSGDEIIRCLEEALAGRAAQ
jgi:FixJ family two-component response regulator